MSWGSELSVGFGFGMSFVPTSILSSFDALEIRTTIDLAQHGDDFFVPILGGNLESCRAVRIGVIGIRTAVK